MDPQTWLAIGGAVATIILNQWVLHLSNAKKREDERKEIILLMKNFPLHKHDNHQGISYPVGMDPRRYSHRD